ncbi:reticulon-1 isoform 1-T1 [Anomaloglossus baeobatrachus]|uniref:reticulon-1 isoform X1 n=1 Tax=Anomaloglossus baeobatrachus TaxID=238106 RepID=UPI003F50427D
MAANPGNVSRWLEGDVAAQMFLQEEGDTAGSSAWGSLDQKGGTSRAQQAEHPPVAMGTTSTDYISSKKLPMDEEGAFYTSLTSDEHYVSQPDSNYFTGILKRGDVSTSLDDEEQLSPGSRSPQEMPAFQSRGLFSSDSGIGMTPAESKDVIKTLSDPMEDDKLEAYKYIDISRSPESNPKRSPEGDEKKPSPMGYDYSYEAATKTFQKDQHSDKASEDLSFAPYMEEPGNSMGLYSDTGTRNTKTSPVKITLTESSIDNDFNESCEDLSDVGLKPSSDIVPTVMVSEPEDDSPESLTPPSIETDGYTGPSGSEKQSKFRISEDELISAMKAKEATKGFPYEAAEEQKPHSVYSEKQDYKSVPALAAVPSSLDNEASSTESGDSEIELVSEDQLAGEEAMQSAYMTFSHIGGPPPSPASPSIQYSILREEREAELDSELIIESCDGSSASEESPKRDQDSPMMKPMMDIIEEENGSRTESFDASDFDSYSSTERKLNMENLAESAAYMKSSYAEGRSDLLMIKKDEGLHQRKATEPMVYQSRVSAKANTGATSPGTLLSKKKAIDLLYWRDVKQTGIVFGSVLLMLFSLTQFSVVSVIAYLALAALSATISFRIYKSVLQAVQKTDEGHPFKNYLDIEISLSQEQIQKYTDCLQVYTNSIVRELRRLFLVQDLVDSLKFAVLMWLLTYVGALFNGLTLLIMAVVSMFSLPAVYDKYQAQIDQYLGLVRTNMNTIVAKIQAKIPGAKQKE